MGKSKQATKAMAQQAAPINLHLALDVAASMEYDECGS